MHSFPQERAAASAIVGIPVILAPAFGPTLGGILTDTFGWSSIFLVNLPIGILAVVLAFLILPGDKTPQSLNQRAFDFAGLTLSTLGVLAVVYAFTLVSQVQPGTQTALNPQGQLYGWGYWLVWVMLGVGVLLLAIFALYETRISKDPVLDLRLFKQYDYTTASVISWINAGVVFGSLFLLPVFFQQVRLPNLSATDAGLALMPQGLAAAVSVTLGGRLYYRLGVRTLVIAGAVLLAASSWLLSQPTYMTPTSDAWGIMLALVLRGFGFGLTLIPVQTMALEVISGPALPKASSLFNVTRQIFSSVGIAATITFFTQRTADHAAELSAQALAKLPPGTKIDPSNPAAQAAIAEIRSKAGTAAINDVFFAVMIGTIVLLLVAFILPARSTLAERRAAVSEGARQPVVAE